MLQFEQLINNKSFVLTFIDILESQKSFNIRDKYVYTNKFLGRSRLLI